MPTHARPRPNLISRPRTTVALGFAVASLSVIAFIHSPKSALADESLSTSTVPTSAQVTVRAGADTAPSLVELEQTRMARTVEARTERAAAIERAQARERRARREARQQRQERRAEARQAARAERAAPDWVMPVPGAGLSAYFGEAGSAWSSGYHTGQDFTAPAGTPVHAVGPGTITSASWSDAYGNIIVITHPDGSESWYAHMSSFELTSGSVTAGDVIGYVGCTGNCFGTHLHLEYHPGGGEAADPMSWLHANGAY